VFCFTDGALLVVVVVERQDVRAFRIPETSKNETIY